MNALLIGALAAIGVWLTAAPAGRRATAALEASAIVGDAGVLPPRRVGVGSAAFAVTGIRRLLGRLWPRSGGGDAAEARLALTQVIALLRAGTAPAVAWVRIAGIPTDDAGAPRLDGLLGIMDDASAHSVRAASRLSRDIGAPLASVLGAVCDALAAKAQADADRQAALAGPRATARLLSWLPVGGVAIGMLLGADPLSVATSGGLPSVAVFAGLVAMLVGRFWTSRLIRTARRAGEGS